MKSPVMIGRILFFNEAIDSDSVMDHDAVENAVSKYHGHYAIAYVVYVSDPDNMIVVRSTGFMIPKIEIPPPGGMLREAIW